VNIVTLQNGLNIVSIHVRFVGRVFSDVAQSLESSSLVTGSLQEGVRELRRIKRFFDQFADCFFDLDRVQPFDPTTWCFWGTFLQAWLHVACKLLRSYNASFSRTSREWTMDKFGDRIRELRNAKGYTLRQLAPLVGVGFSYLSKVENSKLDFAGSASESLIHRLADVLEADEEELLLLASHVPKRIADRILEQPEVFRTLASLDAKVLERFANRAARQLK
jgi:transcriptional regulator with XRE-family HTH domain